MKKKEAVSLVNTCFDFLMSDYGFKVLSVDTNNYGIYIRLKSHGIGIYLQYEYRELIPYVQFSLNPPEDFKFRPGLYTLKELYKSESYKLQSFYLDEILSFKGIEDYKLCFAGIKSIEEGLTVSAELVKVHASDFVCGLPSSYDSLNGWFKKKVVNPTEAVNSSKHST